MPGSCWPGGAPLRMGSTWLWPSAPWGPQVVVSPLEWTWEDAQLQPKPSICPFTQDCSTLREKAQAGTGSMEETAAIRMMASEGYLHLACPCTGTQGRWAPVGPRAWPSAERWLWPLPSLCLAVGAWDPACLSHGLLASPSSWVVCEHLMDTGLTSLPGFGKRSWGSSELPSSPEMLGQGEKCHILYNGLFRAFLLSFMLIFWGWSNEIPWGFRRRQKYVN